MLQQRITRPLEHPKRIDVFFHAIKTLKLIGALLADRRVTIVRKAFFVVSVGALLFILLFPDAINEVFLSAIAPVIGTVVGVPLDAGFDWIALAMVLVTLLRFFPEEMVSEHYMRIFDRW